MKEKRIGCCAVAAALLLMLAGCGGSGTAVYVQSVKEPHSCCLQGCHNASGRPVCWPGGV